MAHQLSFDAEQFLAMSARDRVQLCRQMAERAQELADAAQPKYRASYLEIAKQWLMLADEMERAASGAKIKTGH
jgi:hypothetical protein